MSYAQRVIEGLKQKYASEPVFLQAVEEVLMTLQPLLDKDAKYEKYKILERITEPERIISFRVEWVDDKGEIVDGDKILYVCSTTPPSAPTRAACASIPA